LYLLLPLSVLLVLALIGLFAWALHAGQFDDLEREGLRVLEEPGLDEAAVAAAPPAAPEARSSHNLDDAQVRADRPF
jgi:cbb3-type cytochrome oxidase maturation protein